MGLGRGTVVRTPWWQMPRPAWGAPSTAHLSDTGATGMARAATGGSYTWDPREEASIGASRGQEVAGGGGA